MKIFCMISRASLVAVATLSFVGNAVCAEYNKELKNKLQANQSTIIMALGETYACKKDEHAKKAAFDTLGLVFDRTSRSDKKADEFNVFREAPIHFGSNYAIRKGSEFFGKNVISVDDVVKKCDALPKEYCIRDGVKTVVGTALETATHPEVIKYVAVNYVIPFVQSLTGK